MQVPLELGATCSLGQSDFVFPKTRVFHILVKTNRVSDFWISNSKMCEFAGTVRHNFLQFRHLGVQSITADFGTR